MLNQVIFEETLIRITHRTEVLTTNKDTKGTLTADTLTWLENGEKHSLPLDDMVGAFIAEEQAKNEMAPFVVNAYPLITSKFSKKRKRVLREYKFACPDTEARSSWIEAIHNTLQGVPVDGKQTAAPRRLQILLNPMSGRKRARSIFQQVRPLFEKSYLHFTVTETTGAGHAQDIIQKMSLEEVDALVVVGGDGTIYEAINGLMGREDWKTAILTPIGAIPAGTSNGLCKTLLDISGEPYDPISAAFLIAKGKERPLDIVMTEQDGCRYYSVLSLSWAFVSDVDIESDRLRYLGSLKNDIYALMRIWSLRTYRGKFSFLPALDCNLLTQKECKPFDEMLDVRMEESEKKPETGSMDSVAKDQDEPEVSWLPQLNQPIPQDSGWQVIEDEFVVFWAMNVAWAADDIKAAPHAHLSDGTMDVLVLRQGISKWQLLCALLSSSNGNHISLPYVEYYKVRCFRLEPLTSQGILAVDGEQVDYSLVQMKVLRGLARILS
ncbi:MAG: diacylglycerol kinase family protein [Xenococcaceae cyanobacterium]